MSRPSVNAWTTTSGTPATPAACDQRRRCSIEECTPPSETRPMRWTRSTPSKRGLQHRVARQRAVGDGLVDARQVLADDRAGAEVEVADLGVAHLPLGQPDRAAAGRQLRVRVARPEVVEDRRVGQLDGVAGPGGASPQPSRMTRATPGRPSRLAAAHDRRERLRLERRAADERAVDVGQREQLGGVVGLDRAAVEDPRALAPARRRGRRRARARTRPPPAPARASRPGRCRSPRSARRR